MRSKRIHIILFLFVATFLSSCNINHYIPEGKYLVKKNTIVIEEKDTEISKSGLSSYIVQKPYKTFFQTNIPFWIYYKSQNKPASKFWAWMNKSFGKTPVYYEEKETERSAFQMTRYLDKVGYFHSKVRFSMEPRNKKALITYTVTPTQPYRVNRMDYVINDSLMENYIMRDKEKFPIKEKDIYNEFSLNDQREMITERLKNSGYYFFNRSNISYEVDSNFMDHTLAVTMKISKNESSHKRYYINKISIFPNYSLFKMREQPSDSAMLTVTMGNKRRFPNTMHFYYYDKPNVKPQTLNRSIHIVQGLPYNLRNVTNTYKSLGNFRLFNNVNITFDTVPNTNDSINLLDCKITMQQNDIHSFTLQGEGTKSDSDLGIRGSFSYTNKNLFKGAETFQISLRGGLEAQKIYEFSDSTSNERTFNTREFGVTASLLFPKFLSIIPMRNFARDYQPTTTVSLGFNSQIKYYYSRYITSLSFGYDWKSSNRLKHTFLPVYFNSVKISNINPHFQELLDQETNQRKKDQYTNHLIFGARYSLTINTQSLNKSTSFFYLRADLESSGNLLSLFNNTKLITENNGSHEIFGIRYAQYIRSSFDIRQHISLGNNSWLVLRQFIGLGLPYGNSEDMPFERSFYAGGANSLRGWSYHSVGPGGFNPTLSEIEKIGDMQLELNAEYRFPIYNFINGAVFVDAGNVWTYNPSAATPNSEFRFNSFYKQIALDAGVGVRLDLSFLILRIDLAYAMRNPYVGSTGSYWRFGDENPFKNFKFQLGLGYPF